MRTLVIIDDEPVIRSMLARHLEMRGWRVLEADNGDDGLRLIQSHRPDAVLCDLLMPGTNGFKVCRTIRARRGELGDITIIVTTGSGFPADKQNALDAGADHYLIKPVSAQEVANLLTPVRGAPAAPTGPVAAAAPTAAAAETRIRFWGVRGSIATPGPSTLRYGGNTTCVEVRAAGEIVILDAGTGIRALGDALREEIGPGQLKLTLLLSHTHWDHIQGLPFFGPLYERGNTITVMGYEGSRQSLLKTLSAQMDGVFFPVTLDQISGSLVVRELNQLEFMIGRIPVQAAFTHHPGVTLAYRLSTPAGGVVFMPDTEILPFPRPRPGKPAEASAGADSAPQAFVDYKNQLLAEFVQGAEVLIADAQYTADEYESHIGWGHSCVDDTVELAILGRVKRLVLFHHDPRHDDAAIDALVAHARHLAAARGSTVQIEAAAEGAEIILRRKGR